MLPKSLRIRRTDFSEAKNLKRVTGAFFSGSYTTPCPGTLGKTAVVVSKKVATKAVDRHHLKRQAIHALSTLPKRAYNLIVYARNGSAKLSYKDILKELSDLQKR